MQTMQTKSRYQTARSARSPSPALHIAWLDGKNTKFVPKDPVHKLPGKNHYSNFLANGEFFKLRLFLRNDENLVEFNT